MAGTGHGHEVAWLLLATFGERFAPRFLAAMTPTRLTVFGDPSEAARQALAGFTPTYFGLLGDFTAR